MNTPTLVDPNVVPEFLSGGGEMGQLLRNIDWSNTSLGPISSWPQSLRTTVSICLNSRFPTLVAWGSDMVMLYNDAYRPIAGDKHPHALGARIPDVWSEIWHIIGPMIESVLREGKSTWSEDQLLLLNRYGFPEECYFTFSYSPVYVENGGIGGVFCTVTETTATVATNRRVCTLRDLGHHAADMKCAQDVYDGVLDVLRENPYDFPFTLLYEVFEDGSGARLAGTTGISLLHPAAPELISFSGTQPWAKEIGECVSSNRPAIVADAGIKFRNLPSGAWSVPPEQAYIVPVARPGRNIPYAVLITGINPHVQLTEKYQSFFQLAVDQMSTEIANVNAYNEERRRVEILTELDRAKTNFFSNISHEFRTPLTLMLGPLQDALRDPALQGENRARIEVAQRNALRQLKLVNTLLDFSRIEAGRMDARFRPVNLAALTRMLAGSFQSAIERARLQLVVDCDEHAGPAYVDVDMWEKIVFNLLSNAFKYTLEGTISVSLKRHDNQLVLTVTDTGMGIPEEEQPKVFRRFHRVHHTNGRSQEGTGIGLALVHELVKLHRGSVSLESKLNEGTRMTVSLPVGKDHLPAAQVVEEKELITNPELADQYMEEIYTWLPSATTDEDEDDDATAEPLPSVEMQKADDKRLRLLVVDDNKDMRNYLRRLLRSRYYVTVVDNGARALQIAKETLPDLVLSDVMLPGMNGFELVKALRSDPSTMHTSVILLSARAGEEATIQGLRAGVDDYMVKPFSPKELLSRIDANIRIARSRIHAARQMENLFMSAPVPISIMTGPGHRYQLVNEQFLRIMHRKESEVIGKPFAEVFPEGEEVAQFIQLLDEVYQTGKPYVGREVRGLLRHEDGREMETYFDFSFSPMYDINGEIIGIIGIATDTTMQVKAREKQQENEERLQREVEQRTIDLKKTNEALERSNKDLEQFAFVTSHDLQEPLRKVQTFANLLFKLNKERFDERSQIYFNKMISSSKRMSMLINDLLYFSRLTHEEKFIPTDLNRILEDAVNDFELLIDQKDATIQSEQLPVIEAIPLQMNQLFSNLLSNALKFTSGERKPLIYVSASVATPEEVALWPWLTADQTYYKIVFRDNGIGFDPRYNEKIFEVFQRLNERQTYEGTGMGLAMCSRIVNNHHGVIYARGEENVGAAFHLLLPEKHAG